MNKELIRDGCILFVLTLLIAIYMPEFIENKTVEVLMVGVEMGLFKHEMPRQKKLEWEYNRMIKDQEGGHDSLSNTIDF